MYRAAVIGLIIAAMSAATAQVEYEDAGSYAVEHTAMLEGDFQDAEIILPVPLNWPMQTASELSVEPKDAKIILDESKMVGLAILRVPGPSKTVSLKLSYKIKCHPPKFDKAMLAAREYPPYDEESDEWRDFTRPTTRIDSTAPQIVELGKKFREQEASPYKRARAIYGYVADTLTYVDEDARGSLAALQRGSGCCADYAMLFAAICRAAGIPARECGGYIATEQNRWHSWAEFFLPEVGWLPCDAQTGDKFEETREQYFAGLSGAAFVALAKRHDLVVDLDGEKSEIKFIQSGLVRRRGQGRTRFTLSSTKISPARYCLLFKAERGDRLVECDLSAQQLQEADSGAREDGMRCISLTVAATPSGLTYGAIWEKTSGSRQWKIYPQLTLAELSGLVEQAKANGYMLSSVSSCFHEGKALYAGVLDEAKNANWAAVTGLPREQFMQRLRAEIDKRRVPMSMSMHAEGGQAICSASFEMLTETASISSSFWAQEDRFDEALATYDQDGFVPVAVTVTAGFPAYFHALALKTQGWTAWWVAKGLTGEQVTQAIEMAGSKNLIPVSISAY